MGWKAVKLHVSKVATAAFSLVAGLFGGVFASNVFEPRSRVTVGSLPVTQPAITQPEAFVQRDIEGGPTVNRRLEYKGEATVGIPIRIEPVKKRVR